MNQGLFLEKSPSYLNWVGKFPGRLEKHRQLVNFLDVNYRLNNQRQAELMEQLSGSGLAEMVLDAKTIYLAYLYLVTATNSLVQAGIEQRQTQGDRTIQLVSHLRSDRIGRWKKLYPREAQAIRYSTTLLELENAVKQLLINYAADQNNELGWIPVASFSKQARETWPDDETIVGLTVAGLQRQGLVETQKMRTVDYIRIIGDRPPIVGPSFLANTQVLWKFLATGPARRRAILEHLWQKFTPEFNARHFLQESERKGIVHRIGPDLFTQGKPKIIFCKVGQQNRIGKMIDLNA